MIKILETLVIHRYVLKEEYLNFKNILKCMAFIKSINPQNSFCKDHSLLNYYLL